MLKFENSTGTKTGKRSIAARCFIARLMLLHVSVSLLLKINLTSFNSMGLILSLYYITTMTTTTSTEDCENAILTYLSSSPDAIIDDSYPWSQQSQLDHAKVVGAMKSLLADDYIATEDLATSFYSFEKEADNILSNGSQEMIVLRALVEAGKLNVPDLQKAVGKDNAKIGMGNCMKNKWIKKDGGDLVPIKTLDEVQDEVRVSLQAIKDANFATDAIDDKVSLEVRLSSPSYFSFGLSSLIIFVLLLLLQLLLLLLLFRLCKV